MSTSADSPAPRDGASVDAFSGPVSATDVPGPDASGPDALGADAPGAAEPAPPAGPSGPGALAAVFFSPGALFERLRVQPVFTLAMLVGAVLIALSSALLPAEAFVEAMREAGTELPGGEGMVAVIKWVGVGVALPGYVLMVLLTAGLLTLVFRFILGDEATFRQYLAVASHATLITAVGYLALTPLRIMQGDPELAFSLGTFLPFVQEGYLARFLSGVDLFALWSWVVMALGVSILARERSWSGATAIVLGTGLAFVALFALIPR